jgi:hypothetical protein
MAVPMRASGTAYVTETKMSVLTHPPLNWPRAVYASAPLILPGVTEAIKPTNRATRIAATVSIRLVWPTNLILIPAKITPNSAPNPEVSWYRAVFIASVVNSAVISWGYIKFIDARQNADNAPAKIRKTNLINVVSKLSLSKIVWVLTPSGSET